MEKDIELLGMGPFWDDLSVGDRFRTVGRTLTETDLVNFVNLSWLTEELFTNTEDRKSMAIEGRVVPAALVYACAEGLLLPMIQGTGLAFLNAMLEVKGHSFVCDTIHVECRVCEVRDTSNVIRGPATTENQVINQKGET